MNDYIINILDFKNYKKKKDILEELQSNKIEINERVLRRTIEKNNKLFSEGIVEYYIAHSNQGYKKTSNWNDIKKSISNNRKRAITMLIACDKAEKQFQRRNNLKLNLNDN